MARYVPWRLVSESGKLCRGDGHQARGNRRWRVRVLAILSFFRGRFREVAQDALTSVELTDEERDAFVRRGARWLNQLGGSLHLLISIPGLGGH